MKYKDILKWRRLAGEVLVALILIVLFIFAMGAVS